MGGSTIIVTTVPVIKAMFFGEMFFFQSTIQSLPPRLGHLPADIQPCILGTADVHKDAVPEIREGTHWRNGEKKPGKWSGRLQPVLKNMCHKTGIFPKYPQRTEDSFKIADCWAPPSNRCRAPTPLGTDYCW